jgi:hypothetical protein
MTAVATVFTIVGVNIGLVSWLKSDISSLTSDMKSFEFDIRSEMRQWKDEVRMEMRDFHGRLCSLESRYHQQDMEKK